MRRQGHRHTSKTCLARGLRRPLIGCALLSAACAGGNAPPAEGVSPASPAAAPGIGNLVVRSSHDGVYTEEQAEAGAEVFRTICSACHNEDQPLWGSKFIGLWSGQPLWRLYEFLSQSMPYGGGGTLQPEQYRAVTAYILKINGYPAGDTPIPETPLEIAYINLDPHPQAP